MSKNKFRPNIQPMPSNNVPASTIAVNRKVSLASYQGPIPPSSEMIRYEECCPGAANRILTMAENQGTHRMTVEKQAVSAGLALNKVGQIFAFVIIMTMIILSFVLLIMGKDTQGFITLGTGIVGGLSAYLYGKNKQNPVPKKES